MQSTEEASLQGAASTQQQNSLSGSQEASTSSGPSSQQHGSSATPPAKNSQGPNLPPRPARQQQSGSARSSAAPPSSTEPPTSAASAGGIAAPSAGAGGGSGGKEGGFMPVLPPRQGASATCFHTRCVKGAAPRRAQYTPVHAHSTSLENRLKLFPFRFKKKQTHATCKKRVDFSSCAQCCLSILLCCPSHHVCVAD
jgi:hypothetical protein